MLVNITHSLVTVAARWRRLLLWLQELVFMAVFLDSMVATLSQRARTGRLIAVGATWVRLLLTQVTAAPPAFVRFWQPTPIRAESLATDGWRQQHLLDLLCKQFISGAR